MKRPPPRVTRDDEHVTCMWPSCKQPATFRREARISTDNVTEMVYSCGFHRINLVCPGCGWKKSNPIIPRESQSTTICRKCRQATWPSAVNSEHYYFRTDTGWVNLWSYSEWEWEEGVRSPTALATEWTTSTSNAFSYPPATSSTNTGGKKKMTTHEYDKTQLMASVAKAQNLLAEAEDGWKAKREETATQIEEHIHAILTGDKVTLDENHSVKFTPDLHPIDRVALVYTELLGTSEPTLGHWVNYFSSLETDATKWYDQLNHVAGDYITLSGDEWEAFNREVVRRTRNLARDLVEKGLVSEDWLTA